MTFLVPFQFFKFGCRSFQLWSKILFITSVQPFKAKLDKHLEDVKVGKVFRPRPSTATASTDPGQTHKSRSHNCGLKIPGLTIPGFVFPGSYHSRSDFSRSRSNIPRSNFFRSKHSPVKLFPVSCFPVHDISRSPFSRSVTFPGQVKLSFGTFYPPPPNLT